MACGKLDATVDSGRLGQIPKDYAELCLCLSVKRGGARRSFT